MGKYMKKRERFWIPGFLMLFFVPYIGVMAVNGVEAAIINRTPQPEEYIPLILSLQIPDDYEKEAVKAQAVIARTNFFRKIQEKNISDVLGEISGEIKKEKTACFFPEKIYEKAAEETRGQVLISEGELKLVPYHEISNGQTRDGTQAFHDQEYSYLKSVDSSGDKNSPFYLNSTYIPEQQMPSELNIEQRDASGHVVSLMADEDILEGEAFAQGMGLSSSDFSIQKVGGEFRFLCKGRGHGLGFSQYGGNQLAREGKNWKEILETYFPAMEVAAYEE